MVLKVNNFNYHLPELARRINYKPLGYTEKGELNCVRPMGADYPRFHIYMKEDKEVVILNIHLDQRKTSYEGVSAHNGDYESDTVKEEAARVKEVIFRMH